MKITVASLLVAAACATAAPGARAQVRLQAGVIDVQRILAESEEGKKEIARIKKVQDEHMQHLNQVEAEVKKLKEKLANLGFTISEEERTKLQRQIEDRMIDGERYRKDADRQIKSEFEDVFASFEKRIYPIIEALGTERGVLIIFNRETPGLVWADKSVDITNDVIERFNKMVLAGTAPPPAGR
jgi:outer membrane protein